MQRTLGGTREPVAVVGIGCRLPGVEGPRELWRLLARGDDTVGEIPPDRFDIDRYHDPRPGLPGRISTRAGGFLTDVDEFDADFFGMSGHEAVRLDPQHRLMMRTVWEAVENAGIPAEHLAGSLTGVYTACLNADYWDSVRKAGLSDMHAVAGNGAWGMPAGRLSHLLDLRGPSLGVEATCATSLLAAHLACRDLWSGQAEMAIVAGVNLLLSADFYLSLSESGILSPSGRSRFGDAASDGYVRSEGAVAVVLKPLRTALRDGDRVYATIIGGAVNNNGRANDTLITPGVEGQVSMLRAAHADAGISPFDVDYVEAHGAGTPVGDAVELTALSRVFGEGRPRRTPCLIGSIKSNLGHTESAAGLTGLVKTALALHHGVVPATLHVRDLHPVLAEPGAPLAPVTTARPWPRPVSETVAGVSSFGLSATNVHLVLRAAPATAPAATPRPEGTPTVVPVSARSGAALRALAADHADLVDRLGDAGLDDIAFSAGTRRSHHPHRAAAVGTTAAEIAAALRDIAAGRHAERTSARLPKVVFVYSGQGSQWKGMGRDLFETEPVFRRALLECAEAIRGEAGWWLPDRLDSLDGPAELQPALWAFQVALAATWRAWGVEPDVVVGHSMGEIAAACTAGALTPADGAAIASQRGKLIATLTGRGAMAAVGIGERRAEAAIGAHRDEVAVAVVNGPESVVLAGDPTRLEDVLAPLRAEGVFLRYLDVDYASHSPRIDPIRAELTSALADISPRRTSIPLRSTVSGHLVAGTELDADYWTRNLRDQVRFGPVVQALLDDGPTLLVEISPHPVLGTTLQDLLHDNGSDGAVISSVVRGDDAPTSVRAGLATAYAHGVTPRWDTLLHGGKAIDLPGYRWQGRKYWVRDEPESATLTDDVHTFDAGPSSEGMAGCIDVVLGAMAEMTGDDRAVLTHLRPHGSAEPDCALRVVLHQAHGGWQFAVKSEKVRGAGLSTWTTVLTGRSMRTDPATRREAPEATWRRCAAGTSTLRRAAGESIAWVAAGKTRVELLASARHVLATAAGISSVSLSDVGSLVLAGTFPGRTWLHAVVRADEANVGDVHVLADDGSVLGELRSWTFTDPLQADEPAAPADLDSWFVTTVATLLGSPPQDVNRTKPLPDQGMDSILATRLLHRIRTELGITLTTRALLGTNTVDAVIDELTSSPRTPTARRHG
ncbi:MAG: acyltransferase domain-containing protein [Umezawaea sp.]